MTNTVSFPKLGLEFTVNRVAFTLGSVTITWYGLLIAAGILLAMCFAFYQAKKFGIIADKLMDAALGGVIGGIVGARLYYVAFRWEDYKDDLSSIFKTWEGGMAIYGGLIGGLLIGLLAAKIRKVRILPAMDLAVMGFLIGQSIGRWGEPPLGHDLSRHHQLPAAAPDGADRAGDEDRPHRPGPSHLPL